jgi:hypothetical protein
MPYLVKLVFLDFILPAALAIVCASPSLSDTSFGSSHSEIMRETGREAEREAGRLGAWEAGRLGGWEGGWRETGRLGGRMGGRLGGRRGGGEGSGRAEGPSGPDYHLDCTEIVGCTSPITCLAEQASTCTSCLKGYYLSNNTLPHSCERM